MAFLSLSLHQKILFSISGALFVFLSVFTLLFYFTNEHLEDQLIDDQISYEVGQIKFSLNNKQKLKLPRSHLLNVYAENNHPLISIPEYIYTLDVGSYHDIHHQLSAYHVTVFKVNGIKYFVVYDISELEIAEDRISILLFILWLIFIAIIIFFSIQLSRLLSRPIQRLSHRISQLDPSQRGVKLDLNFPDNELGQIADGFDLYLSKMDEYVEKQMAFSAMASHELRSPLTVIQTSADLISCFHTDKATTEHIEKIQKSSQNMAKLIQALLYITRNEQISGEIEVLYLAPFIDGIIVQLNQEITKNKILVKNDISNTAQVNCSPLLLSVVLTNLLKNAIKFSHDSNINVNFEHHALKISDQGSGIKQHEFDKIFDFKYKSESSQGYGIGLYLSKLICDQCGWDLSFIAHEEKGTTVKLSFKN